MTKTQRSLRLKWDFLEMLKKMLRVLKLKVSLDSELQQVWEGLGWTRPKLRLYDVRHPRRCTSDPGSFQSRCFSSKSRISICAHSRCWCWSSCAESWSAPPCCCGASMSRCTRSPAGLREFVRGPGGYQSTSEFVSCEILLCLTELTWTSRFLDFVPSAQ